MLHTRIALTTVVLASLSLGACGGSSDESSTASTPAAADTVAAGQPDASVRVVSPADAAATIADPPDDLVILDVRTPEEFATAHIDGAVVLDFYSDDFADRLAALDPDVPYVLYCQSGNRSGQTRAMMETLGFADVEDVEGGIVGWQNAGLPVVAG